MRHLLAAAGPAPAGGAPFTQILVVFGVTMLVFAAVAHVVWREALGRATPVGKLADRLAALTDVPRWAALTGPLHLQSIVLAGIGVYWDVPYHYDFGRDEGPLANPAHYFIFFGLLGMVATGGFAIALARRPLPRRPLRIGRGWRVPYGAALILIGGLFGFVAFPMDDVWHRMFGQDVTLWGPTHVLLLGGALFALFGSWLLCAEAQQVVGRKGFLVGYELGTAAWVVLCLSAYLMEFDLGGPQFPLLADPVLLTAFAAIALPAARARLFRGSLLLVWAVYFVLRLTIGGIDRLLDTSVPHIPLVLGSALLVEAVALTLGTARRTRFALVSGLLIGTVGVLVEAGWTRIGMPLAWPAGLLATAVPLCAAVGAAGALAGVWLAGRLDTVAPGADPEPARSTPGRTAAALGLAAVLAACAWVIPPTADTHGTAALSLTDAGPATGDPADREVNLTVRVEPAGLAEGAVWFSVFSWQGGAIERQDLQRIGDGLYRTEKPVRAGGAKWKTLIRLHRGTGDLVAVPVYLPADPAIPAAAVPAEDGAVRPFVREQSILQRETRLDVPGWAWTTGYLAVAVVFALMLGTTVLVLARASRPAAARTGPAARTA
ncbi:hypothetical protein [Kitasatospora terrestris]